MPRSALCITENYIKSGLRNRVEKLPRVNYKQQKKKIKSIEGSEEAFMVKKPGRWKTSGTVRYTIAASLFVFFNFSNF